MKFTIDEYSAIHVEGTKYYSIFEISCDSSSGAVLATNWGSHTGGTAVYFPLHSGKTKIETVHARSIRWDSERKRNLKTKRGYKFEKSSTLEFHDLESFSARLNVVFSYKDAESIRAHIMSGMGELSGKTSSYAIVDDFEPEVIDDVSSDFIVNDKPLKSELPPVKQNPEWGTW